MVAISPTMDMVFPHTPYLDRPLQHQMLLDTSVSTTRRRCHFTYFHNHTGYHPELPLISSPQQHSAFRSVTMLYDETRPRLSFPCFIYGSWGMHQHKALSGIATNTCPLPFYYGCGMAGCFPCVFSGWMGVHGCGIVLIKVITGNTY
jgi:hypothetical protein